MSDDTTAEPMERRGEAKAGVVVASELV